jgi:hypothetical protein
MYRNKRVCGLLYLVLLTIALCWAGSIASAQQKPSRTPGKIPGQTIITDVAGRVHVRNPKITDAQRKAVAKRQQAARIKAAKKGK